MFPVVVYGCKTRTLNLDLERRIAASGNKYLHRIMGYHYNDLVSNQRLLREIHSTFRHFLLAYLVKANSEYTGTWHITRKLILLIAVVSAWNNPKWRRQSEPLRILWHEQDDISCREVLRMGRENAWRIAGKDHRTLFRSVGEATSPLSEPLAALISLSHSHLTEQSTDSD